MQRTIDAVLDAGPERVFDTMADLTCYPDWLDIVAAVTPADAVDGDPGPAWFVTLRAKVGPFARSKRLRMARTVATRPDTLRFERVEHDGRQHAPWILDVALAGDDDARTVVAVELRYEGALWMAPLDAILGRQVDDAVPRLQALVRA